MNEPLISLNIVVHNGEKYIRHCLDSIKRQSYENFEINIWDNNSTDNTKEIIENCKFPFFESKENLGMWPAHEKLLEHSKGKYIAVISADIILHQDFATNAIQVLESDPKIGALEPKVMRFLLKKGEPEFTDYIDTLGFKIFKSREINNIGHGERIGEFLAKNPEFNSEKEIFAVEGACPVFRKETLEDCWLPSTGSGQGEIIDPNMFWYGDDLDIAWRMRIFGWKEVYSPLVVAWHDRKTTKTITKSRWQFIKSRREIPMFKRGLDWRNTRLTIIKNDFFKNFIKDLPRILIREGMFLGYIIFFEFPVLWEILKLLWLLPQTLRKRRIIMGKARVSADEFRKWLN